MTVYINGVGLCGAFGCGKEDFLKAISPEPSLASVILNGRMEEIPYLGADSSPLEKWIPKQKVRRYDFFSRLALLAAFEALDNASLSKELLDQTGIVTATGYGPMKTNFGFIDSLIDYGEEAPSPLLFSNSVYNSTAAHISMNLSCHGPSATVSQFDMSVFSGLITAISWLEEEKCEYVLLGGVDEFHPILGYFYHHQYRLNKNTVFTPSNWLIQSAIPGEGACFFVLSKKRENAFACIESVRIDCQSLLPCFNKEEGLVIGVQGFRNRASFYNNITRNHPFVYYSTRYGAMPVGSAFDIVGALCYMNEQLVSVVQASEKGDYGWIRLQVF